ncbi:DUF6270 domain-containing protein [Promicromonospora panici]|uniref:DUF6270 domain-containing protein n=1 Tax=Promicromonospora panici TaxID=2219658 RepID=UPI00101D031B|nr:DUF6270 domain-containing protein [Promicromonospora panici]
MSKTRVFIYGSCVSRDTFEHLDPKQFELVEYVARQSVLSATTRPVESVAPPTLTSRFQQRMVTGDFQSSLRPLLAQHAADIDVLLIDLTDERLGVYLLPDGTVVTRSVELIESGAEQLLPPGAQHVAFGTQQHYEYWSGAIRALGETIRTTLPRAAVALLDIPWAEWSESGQQTPDSFGVGAAQANPVFRSYVEVAAQALGAHVIALGPSEVMSGPHHPWGDAPFHYAEGVYLEAVRRLTGAEGRVVWGPGARTPHQPDDASPSRAVVSEPTPRPRSGSQELAEKPYVSRLTAGPNLVLAGTWKGGVEWLARNMSGHPEIAVPAQSTNFFNRRSRVRDAEAANEYESALADSPDARWRIDASPNYFWQGDGGPLSVTPHETAEAVRAVAPEDTQVVVILRNPVERAVSHYWTQFAAGKLDVPSSIFTLPPSTGVIDYGFYRRHYEHWADVLGTHRVHVLLYDDLVADPQQFVTAALRILGLHGDSSFWEKTRLDAPSDRTAWMAPFRKRNPVSSQEIAALQRVYAEDIAFVEQLVGQRLDAWHDFETIIKHG